MAKTDEKKKEEEAQAYLDNYKGKVEHLYYLSRFNVRQFMGTRQEGDPRVEYLAGLEGFKNLANAQISAVVRAMTALLGDKKQEFMDIMAEELDSQLKAMEDEVGVTGWTADGQPQFDLTILREKTKGWPA